MTKKLTTHRTLSWQERHLYELWRTRKHLMWIRWTLFGLGVAYVVNALAGRVWP